MGNFYVNIAVKADGDRVRELLRSLQRQAFMACSDRIVVVVDREADTQNLDIIASLALTLSNCLAAPALACLNHDDDALLLGLYEKGALVQEYMWGDPLSLKNRLSAGRRRFAGHVRRAFGTTRNTSFRPPEIPLPGFLKKLAPLFMRAVFAVRVHQALMAETGLPSVCAGAGFSYVSRGHFQDREPSFVRV